MKLIKIEAGVPAIPQETVKKAIKLQEQYKRVEQKLKAFKSALIQEMEKNNIIKIESEEMSINYIPAFDRESFDSKAFRKAEPDLYDEYVKLTTVQPSVRIKLKETDNGLS